MPDNLTPATDDDIAQAMDMAYAIDEDGVPCFVKQEWFDG